MKHKILRSVTRRLRRTPTETHPWAVEHLDPTSARARAKLRWLGLQPGYRILDTLQAQLEDLAATDHPGVRLQGPALEAAVATLRRGRSPERCGIYVHYPWKREVVRVLERDDFIRLRTNRNWYKITPAEQNTLSAKCVAVAGLSVGLAVVTTLALERVGGRFHIADFDELALTNLNRLLAGVADLGVPKTVIAARRLLELDPYLELRVFSQGVTPENVGAFLEGVDLLVEECDDLAAKLYLREQARARRMPVLMQTSEGGLLDLERFDLEPDRRVFHGLVGELTAAQLPTMDRRQKVPFVARIVEDGLSDRGAASMLEIETTLSTWPQLGSAVVAGAGAAVDAARRVLLGQLQTSGRFLFDPATAIVPGAQRYEQALVEEFVAPLEGEKLHASLPAAAALELPHPRAVRELTQDQVEALVAIACRAPSGGNVQPWSFQWDPERQQLHLRLVPGRGEGILNRGNLANALALGAAAESVVLAATSLGLAVEPLPRGPLAELAGATYSRLTFDFASAASIAVDPLASRLASRSSNRNHVQSAPLAPSEVAAVQGDLEPARLHWFTSSADLARLGAVLAEGDRQRILHPVLHAEMMGELRLPDAAPATLDDGIEATTMDMDGADLAVLRLWRRPAVAAFLRRLDLGRGIHQLAVKRLRCASAAVVVRTEARTFDSFFTAGRELLRLWLRAEAAGLAVHPWGALGYLVQHAETDAHSAGLELGSVRRAYRELVPQQLGGEAMLLVLHRAPAASRLSRRRPIETVLTLAGAVPSTFERSEDS